MLRKLREGLLKSKIKVKASMVKIDAYNIDMNEINDLCLYVKKGIKEYAEKHSSNNFEETVYILIASGLVATNMRMSIEEANKNSETFRKLSKPIWDQIKKLELEIAND